MGHCLIVGAGTGLGEAIGRRFGRGGDAVSLIARGREALTALSERLSADGIATHHRDADAGDAPALRSAIAALQAEVGPCTTLIYNAAAMRPASPLTVSPERLCGELRVNVAGALVAAQAVAPSMIARGQGAILFTGGGLALEPYPEWASLALGKAALRNLAFSLYKELAPRGIHVSVIAVCGIVAPGTPFDPALVAEEYWRLATAPRGLADRELVFQPPGTDPFYNDPDRRHWDTTCTPHHVLPHGSERA